MPEYPHLLKRLFSSRAASGIGAGILAVALTVSTQLYAANSDYDTAGSSVEYGQVHLPEIFSDPDAESMKPPKDSALSNTTYDLHLRTFYFDRDKFDDSESQAWAAGGWIGMKTGYFGNRVAVEVVYHGVGDSG